MNIPGSYAFLFERKGNYDRGTNRMIIKRLTVTAYRADQDNVGDIWRMLMNFT